jgi:hypothetical protein
MIHRRYRDATWQKGGPELQIEKMVKNYPDTAHRRLPEAGIAQYPKNGSRLGYIRYTALHFFSTLIDAA